MPERVRDYKRSKKLDGSGAAGDTFVKPRWWCEEIDIEGVVLRKGEPVMWHGKVGGYNYYIEEYGEYDPSIDTSEAYSSYFDARGREHPEVDANGYVPERRWPQQIDLPDGTILRKTWKGRSPIRYATYYVETWGEADPSLPESECYEGEFDPEG